MKTLQTIYRENEEELKFVKVHLFHTILGFSNPKKSIKVVHESDKRFILITIEKETLKCDGFDCGITNGIT